MAGRAVELAVINYHFLTRHDRNLRTLAGYRPHNALMEEGRVRWTAFAT